MASARKTMLMINNLFIDEAKIREAEALEKVNLAETKSKSERKTMVAGFVFAGFLYIMAMLMIVVFHLLGMF